MTCYTMKTHQNDHLVAETLYSSMSQTHSSDSPNSSGYLFRAHSGYICHETFSFMISLPAVSLGLRFCVNRKGGTRGGGWVHPKGANSMAASGLVSRNDSVGTGRAISVLFGLNGVRNKRSHYIVGPPFPAFTARFFSYDWLVFLKRLN